MLVLLLVVVVLVGVLVDLCQGPWQVQLPSLQLLVHQLSGPSCRRHCWARLPLLLHTLRLRLQLVPQHPPGPHLTYCCCCGCWGQPQQTVPLGLQASGCQRRQLLPQHSHQQNQGQGRQQPAAHHPLHLLPQRPLHLQLLQEQLQGCCHCLASQKP
jgi:hypothetical protein